MAGVAFIGDELTAAGFRLAGVVTHTPDRPFSPEDFARISEACELLLVTEAYARELPQGVLQAALRERGPLLLIVPDTLREHIPPDLAHEVDRALGIEE